MLGSSVIAAFSEPVRRMAATVPRVSRRELNLQKVEGILRESWQYIDWIIKPI